MVEVRKIDALVSAKSSMTIKNSQNYEVLKGNNNNTKFNALI